MKIKRLAASILVTAGLGFAAPSFPVSISFTATDLPDAVVGEDLWRYSYTVSGSFAAFEGFNLLFTPDLYGQLQDPAPAPNSDWSVLILDQPNQGLPADGIYRALALVGNPSLADPFTVDFVWLGGPRTPGDQPFEVFDETFVSVPDRCEPPSCSTVPPGGTQVPLPGTLALLVAGALALAARRPRNAMESNRVSL